MGHYANECRSSAPSSSGFRNPIKNRTDIKKEHTMHIKFCKYCKKNLIMIFLNVGNEFLMKIKRNKSRAIIKIKQ